VWRHGFDAVIHRRGEPGPWIDEPSIWARATGERGRGSGGEDSALALSLLLGRAGHANRHGHARCPRSICSANMSNKVECDYRAVFEKTVEDAPLPSLPHQVQ